jgi:hypothetical protein
LDDRELLAVARDHLDNDFGDGLEASPFSQRRQGLLSQRGGRGAGRIDFSRRMVPYLRVEIGVSAVEAEGILPLEAAKARGELAFRYPAG